MSSFGSLTPQFCEEARKMARDNGFDLLQADQPELFVLKLPGMRITSPMTLANIRVYLLGYKDGREDAA